MYPAIKSNVQRIANEAYQIWRLGGDFEAHISKSLKDANMTEWANDVRNYLTFVIRENYFDSRL